MLISKNEPFSVGAEITIERQLVCRNLVVQSLCLCTAEVCNQKAEVGEGAGEGAERLPTDFYKDLECFCLPSVPIVSMGYDQKHFCHGRGRGRSF
jgi:hypothetical protein